MSTTTHTIIPARLWLLWMEPPSPPSAHIYFALEAMHLVESFDYYFFANPGMHLAQMLVVCAQRQTTCICLVQG